MRATLKTQLCFAVTAIFAATLILSLSGCSKEKVVIYGELPPSVTLVYPPNSVDSAFVAAPIFRWLHVSDAVGYHIQIASNVVFTDIIAGADVGDTFYTAPSQTLNNGAYYWRVRAKNSHNVWGDWPDASIWTFKINDNSNYIRLLSSILTIGVPQDLVVENNIAYVADGEAELTLVDIADPAHPSLIGNIDVGDDDFAKGVWKLSGNFNGFEKYVFIADMVGKVKVIDASLPLNPYAIGNSYIGLDQSLEDLMGIVYRDSLYLFTVASGNRNNLFIYRICYDLGGDIPLSDPDFSVNEIRFPDDAMGLWFDTMTVYVQYHDTLTIDSTYYDRYPGRFIYVADNSTGLWMIDISASHPFAFSDSIVELIGSPNVVGWGDTPGNALSVQTRGGFAYVAGDRMGLQIFKLPDTVSSYDNVLPVPANPVLIASINTSGRTKDLQIIGDYCFLADGSGGLKVINITNPYVPLFVAAYTTPYAYGIWADSSYIYIADRDLGVVIFENLVL
jgi:hypothetical protein